MSEPKKDEKKKLTLGQRLGKLGGTLLLIIIAVYVGAALIDVLTDGTVGFLASLSNFFRRVGTGIMLLMRDAVFGASKALVFVLIVLMFVAVFRFVFKSFAGKKEEKKEAQAS